MPGSPSVLAGQSITPWIRCVLLTGVAVALADYAIGFGIFVAALGRPVLGVFQAPAAGILGPAAFRGGLQTAALGTLLHFTIGIGWAGAFALLFANSHAVGQATSRPAGLFLISTLAGSIIWMVMNNIVAALGRGRPEPFGTPTFWAVLVAHCFFVGLPLVWCTRRFAPHVSHQDLRSRQGNLIDIQ